MGDDESVAQAGADPRAILARWANDNDEWVRFVVRQVLDIGRALSSEDAENAYQLFRQEKAFDERTAPAVPASTTASIANEADEPLIIAKLSDVAGVNALVPGAVIEPHAGLTILFGENGTGKTGYSRIFKALAASRTADDVILDNIAATAVEPQSAIITYMLGSATRTLEWSRQRGVSPFIRMSIFDSPSVNFHLDDDLEYTCVPAALALLNHVIPGIKAVQVKIDGGVRELNSGATTLLSRFPKDAAAYPLIETLGAATDLDALKAKADTDPKVEDRIDVLRQAVAAPEANTIGAQITTMTRVVRVLDQLFASRRFSRRSTAPNTTPCWRLAPVSPPTTRHSAMSCSPPLTCRRDLRRELGAVRRRRAAVTAIPAVSAIARRARCPRPGALLILPPRPGRSCTRAARKVRRLSVGQDQ